MNFPFSRLLLATEHTEFDVGAERVALKLAESHALPLRAVLPIVTNVEYEAMAPATVAGDEQAAFVRITELRHEARASGVEFDIDVRRGADPSREIIADASAIGADLIIARRRGRRSILANLLVGEMVGNVATNASCSVLLVPRAGRVWSRRVLAAVDPTHATAEVVRTAARIALDADIPLLVVSAIAQDTHQSRVEADDAVQGAVAIAREIGAVTEGKVVAGPVAETVVELTADAGADLIVAGRGRPSDFGRRFRLGGNVRPIIGYASGPVLVVKS